MISMGEIDKLSQLYLCIINILPSLEMSSRRTTSGYLTRRNFLSSETGFYELEKSQKMPVHRAGSGLNNSGSGFTLWARSFYRPGRLCSIIGLRLWLRL
jgi:hypothetical protein